MKKFLSIAVLLLSITIVSAQNRIPLVRDQIDTRGTLGPWHVASDFHVQAIGQSQLDNGFAMKSDHGTFLVVQIDKDVLVTFQPFTGRISDGWANVYMFKNANFKNIKNRTFRNEGNDLTLNNVVLHKNEGRTAFGIYYEPQLLAKG